LSPKQRLSVRGVGIAGVGVVVAATFIPKFWNECGAFCLRMFGIATCKIMLREIKNSTSTCSKC